MVALVKKGSSKPFCGGSLISSRTVLTSARCAQQINSNVVVHIGEHDVKQDDGEQKIGVKRFTIHPEYKKQFTIIIDPNTVYDNDFAIIELSRDVEFSNTVMPICLPQEGTWNKQYNNVVAITAGWSSFFSLPTYTPFTPYKAEVGTLNTEACTNNTIYKAEWITDNMICVGNNGDSGFRIGCQGKNCETV